LSDQDVLTAQSKIVYREFSTACGKRFVTFHHHQDFALLSSILTTTLALFFSPYPDALALQTVSVLPNPLCHDPRANLGLGLTEDAKLSELSENAVDVF
jgi:hypothetical protein